MVSPKMKFAPSYMLSESIAASRKLWSVFALHAKFVNKPDNLRERTCGAIACSALDSIVAQTTGEEEAL